MLFGHNAHAMCLECWCAAWNSSRLARFAPLKTGRVLPQDAVAAAEELQCESED